MTMMPSRKGETVGHLYSLTPPNGEVNGSSGDERAMALLALNHTPVEHQLYQAMLKETLANGTRVARFSVQHLTRLTGINSYTTIRRARAGLVDKLSIERRKEHEDGRPGISLGAVYFIFHPEEIFERRRAVGLAPYPVEGHAFELSHSFAHAFERVVEEYDLTRREAQVALCCAEGLTNHEIGERLYICKQTVKFHLRHIFAKCGVRRRTELISRLLMQRD
jgi:DNA-binding NarL/FixJ family response regulator